MSTNVLPHHRQTQSVYSVNRLIIVSGNVKATSNVYGMTFSWNVYIKSNCAGTTTLLTTCTISINGKSGIPKVSYSTALDLFFLLCFSFVFAALVEYAGVNYFTKGAQSDVIHTSDDVNIYTFIIIYYKQPGCAKFLLPNYSNILFLGGWRDPKIIEERVVC